MFHNNSQIRVCFYILTYYERISFQRTMSRLSDDFYPLCPHAKSIFAYGFDWIYVHCAYGMQKTLSVIDTTESKMIYPICQMLFSLL